MKKSLFAILSFAFSFAAMAQNAACTLVVTDRQGASWAMALSEVNRIAMGGESLDIHCISGQPITSFAYADVAHIQFPLDYAGISTPLLQARMLKATVVGDELLVSGLDESRSLPVEVYDARGRLLSRSSLRGAGSVDISALIPGAYIVKADAQTVKFQK